MIVIKNPTLRKVLKYLIPLVLIPVCIVLGVTVFDQKRYAFVCAAVTVLSLLLFAAGYEKKRVGSRRMVITSVLTALSVAGRFIPFFKPVTAMTVIAGVWLGGEAGFLVGALSAVISNFYFGHGPWTPFQMLSWGLIGLAAGMLSKPLHAHRLLVVLYGVIAGIFYSFVMDVWTVLWHDNGFSMDVYKAAVLSALPYTVLYAISNGVFLFLLAPPIGEKLDRIRIKYGV